MTAPSEPSVEASEALALALHNAVDGDFLIDAGGPDDWRGLSECGIADVVRWATTAVIAVGWISPADHERAVRQARAEGAAEALRKAADAMPSSITARGDEKPISSVYAARIWLRNRADNLAQPEDARDGEQQ